jgi:predicted adenine nucleotide alpha hydrolase (AANH) superfamily ATPase
MKVVLHICCGICAAGAAERLISEGHKVVGYFYNPNIHPREEYERRLEAAYEVSHRLNFPLEVGPYTPEKWLEETHSLKDEPEGGKRCEVCFRLRLQKTYYQLKDVQGDAFTTTLTISPHKSFLMISSIGREIGGEKFLAIDFKKRDGFKQAHQLARQWGLYRQNYCGCVYSMREAKK